MDLKQKLKKAGIMQKWLAKEIGVKYDTLNKYLNNYFKMPLEVEEKINEILKNRK